MIRSFYGTGLCVLLFWNASVSQDAERLSLDDAVAMALKNNSQVLASSAAVDAERGRFWRGIAPPPPTVGVDYEYIPRGAAVRQFGERSIAIGQSIDFPTTIYLRGRALSTSVKAAQAEHSAASGAIALQVKIAYYDVLAKQKKIGLSRENLGIVEDFARKAELRYNVGEATNLERLTAAVQRTQAQSAVESAENDLKISMGALELLLGRGADTRAKPVVLTDTLSYQPMSQTLERLTETAYASNPQIMAASRKADAASLTRAAAWSGFLPNLNASYYRQTLDGNSNFYGVTFGISLPLWFMFDQRGQIEEASADLAAAEHELRSVNNAIGVNVRNAFWEMETNERQIRLHQTQIVPQAEEVYRTARAAYEAGEIGYVEFFQARQLLIAARNDYIDQLVRYSSSLARLEYAVGSSFIQQH